MSKHLKIFVSVLFIVIITLLICITRFYFDVSKDTAKNISNPVVYSRTEQSANGLCIFTNENSLSGVSDKDGNIILEPVWNTIEIENENSFVVSSDSFGNQTLYGCVDSEGNVKVPFVYSGFEKFGTENMTFYVGKVAGSDSCIIYNNSFNPCFNRVWQGYEISGNKIKLCYNENVYSYFAGDDGISLKSAVIKNKAMKKIYSVSINSRVLLSKLDYRNLEKISDCISAYLNYAFTENFSYMEDYVISGQNQEYSAFFEACPEVVSKRLRAVKDISVYQEKTNDGKQYITASVKISAGISYDSDSSNFDLTDNYHAVLRFQKKEFGTVNMISASFSDDNINPEEFSDSPEN
ncbi:MAG TPA: hypothetical protein DCQ78_06375 [Ruminococcus sp.]|nr:hypothetical protein [Ruminococcus sp.]